MIESTAKRILFIKCQWVHPSTMQAIIGLLESCLASRDGSIPLHASLHIKLYRAIVYAVYYRISSVFRKLIGRIQVSAHVESSRYQSSDQYSGTRC